MAKKIISNLLINTLGGFSGPLGLEKTEKVKKMSKWKKWTFAKIRDDKMLKPFHYH